MGRTACGRSRRARKSHKAARFLAVDDTSLATASASTVAASAAPLRVSTCSSLSFTSDSAALADAGDSMATSAGRATLPRLPPASPRVMPQSSHEHDSPPLPIAMARAVSCQICFDPLDALQAHECSACGGAFCASCTRWYIEFKVLEGEVSPKKLVCPAPQCTRALPEEQIEAFVPPEVFAKYKRFLKNQRAGARFCPRAGCCAALDEPLFSTQRRVTCPECRLESCMRCGQDWHALPTCRRVEKRFGRWKKRHNVRKCPRCATDIEKHGGCAHMRCFQCDEEFCWACLRPWEAHDETLCLPLAFLRSKSRKYGCWAPLRVVTKTAVAGAAVVVAVAGAGVAVVVLPPLLAVHFTREFFRRKRLARRSYPDAMAADHEWRADGDLRQYQQQLQQFQQFQQQDEPFQQQQQL